MEVRFEQMPGERVDMYSVRCGTVVYHAGNAYLAAEASGGLLGDRIAFINLRTGMRLGDAVV